MRINRKRIYAFLAAVVMVFSFCACAGETAEPDVAMKIGGTEIGSDVYAYYLDIVLQDSDESLTEDDAMRQAEELCAEYVKVNTEFTL